MEEPIMRRIITGVLGLALLISAMAIPALGQGNTIADIVIAASSTDGPDDNPNDYDLLLAAILADDVLTAAVSGTGDFEGVDLTVAAPKDNAFLRLTGETTEADAAQWLEDNIGLGTPAMQNIVLYHVILDAKLDSQDVFFTDYDQIKKVEMANGDDIKVRWVQFIDGTKNRVKPAIKALDIMADNGIIHTITEVLLPPAK
jgi:uncharacterized surface protein with fasciclin (FAS1) repeats